MLEEIWKQYENSIYEVSNYGKVRNIKTNKEKKQHKKNNGRLENDYMYIAYNTNGVKKNISVHRMVAKCFLKDYSDDLEVNHINCLRYDNRVSNLEMCTREYNVKYSIENGKGSSKKPVKGTNIETKEEKIFDSLWSASKYIKKEQNKNVTLDHICNNIKQNIKGKCKYSYNYIWEFI